MTKMPIMFPTHVGMNRGCGYIPDFQSGMFPTHVGMNRESATIRPSPSNVPHTRGDEPCSCSIWRRRSCMFPTHVGMNRLIA